MASQMKDLFRMPKIPFDGMGTGFEADTWLIGLDRYFSMYPFASNVRARYAIMQLTDTASSWWRTEERKLGITIDTLTWDLFLESFRDWFLSDQWK